MQMPILPLLTLFVCILVGGGWLLYSRHLEKGKKRGKSLPEATANEFVNVRDIQDGVLYTNDGQALVYLRVHPLSIDLYSKNEKYHLIRNLTAELSGVQENFQLLAVSRPIDISPLMNELTGLLATPNRIQKTILREEIAEMNMYATSGEIIERRFYFTLWSRESEDAVRDLQRRARQFMESFSFAGLKCEVLADTDIVQLCNMINNPAYTHLEDCDTDPVIPVIAGI
jgi:hypothetical protein